MAKTRATRQIGSASEPSVQGSPPLQSQVAQEKKKKKALSSVQTLQSTSSWSGFVPVTLTPQEQRTFRKLQVKKKQAEAAAQQALAQAKSMHFMLHDWLTLSVLAISKIRYPKA